MQKTEVGVVMRGDTHRDTAGMEQRDEDVKRLNRRGGGERLWPVH